MPELLWFLFHAVDPKRSEWRSLWRHETTEWQPWPKGNEQPSEF